MKAALIGLLQSGKSTILASVSGKSIPAAGATAIEEAIVPVPDERIDWLAEYAKPKKITHATIDCLDLPGFNFTDDHGRAAARRLISQIRTVDLLVLVVRAFESAAVPPLSEFRRSGQRFDRAANGIASGRSGACYDSNRAA